MQHTLHNIWISMLMMIILTTSSVASASPLMTFVMQVQNTASTEIIASDDTKTMNHHVAHANHDQQIDHQTSDNFSTVHNSVANDGHHMMQHGDGTESDCADSFNDCLSMCSTVAALLPLMVESIAFHTYFECLNQEPADQVMVTIAASLYRPPIA